MNGTMWAEWPIVLGAATALIAVLSYSFNRGNQYLTLREHNEFKALVLKEFDRFDKLQQERVTIDHFDKSIDNINRALDKAEKSLENRVDDVKFVIENFIANQKKGGSVP